MRTAIVVAGSSVTVPGALQAERFQWGELESCDLNQYDAVLLLGSGSLEAASALTPAASAKLWDYVERGGRLYAELVEAFDFSSSRLFGWKQDFPATRRTVEKLRSKRHIPGLTEGALLEWSGAMRRGFAVDAEVWLSIGHYQDTHMSSKEGSGSYPGLVVRKLGLGIVVYVAFSLLTCTEPVTLRPYSRWRPLLLQLEMETGLPLLAADPPVTLAGKRTSEQAVKASARWFIQSGMLPEADGSAGVYENIHSVTVHLAKDRRPDCHAHTAFMFHLYGTWKKDQEWLDASSCLLHYLFDQGYQDMDPASPSYGFFKWFDYPGKYPQQIFTDDNAWVCFVLLYLYRKTGNAVYRERGLLLAAGLLATQREDGLRPSVLTRDQLALLGREGVRELDASMNPHFESIAHAAFIQAYLVTGDEAYLNSALKGSRTLLANRDHMQFMYSRTSGWTRLLLPLGYLARHDHTGEIASGLCDIAQALTVNQHALGGIEEADNPDPERFGLEDAGVYISNGEGIADQLYTNNFLVMNSWEMWRATGNESYKKLHEDVAAFMRSIQICSADSRFDGGWMRAFDMNSGEYFGNNGDTGWGPYCMESGWTNALTSAGLLLALLNESVFD
ncbi:hypothetical protein D3P07_24515 [Paenibacillus sp. 1011MAR3C5]|uniref:hypothetical protein n=1 Tax=Paenibacillus sp. 1011MAR3C5 TaxID=1675787 RepID=UPI000E6D13A9|nr:hypothetical protein [Paenibacillus sp. 1011MAR3C5]RJE83970.1 hypothetical protein D3P07_24515 [Paenibacillus sp. 1011MAR3C5]